MEMNKVELLAPAGSFEALKAAVNNGADAIYLGGKNFSARAFAKNFDHEELIEAITYCHLRNVKIYITVNTLLNDYELENAIKECDFYYRNNVDALIIQDFGLYYLLKEKYPDFELHCSTQMHIHNIEGLKVAKSLGFKRVVIPRESNLDFIKEACKLDIEIECFVHGAICVSYSGQCLMSSITNNRSANKGMCAQCCRLDYKLYKKDDSKILNKDNPYILSPKDMFLLNDLPSLIEAGVNSFKIEGRMKSPAYVGYVTSVYRKAIDSYFNDEEFILDDESLYNLKVLFNRDFTNGYLNNDLDNIFDHNKPNHLGVLIGEVLDTKNNKVRIKLFKTLNQFDGVRIVDKDYEEGFIVNYLYVDGKLKNSANMNDVIELKCKHMFTKGSLLYKTIDKDLEDRILNIKDKKLPLNINASFLNDEEVIIKGDVLDYNFEYHTDIICQKAKNAPLNNDNIIKQFSKLNDTPYYLNETNINIDNAFLTIKELNDIRRKLIEYINDERLNSFIRKEIKTNLKYHVLKDQIDKIDIIQGEDNNEGININSGSPININNQYDDVIYDFGGLLKEIDPKIAYYTLNVCNSYAYELLMKLGFKYIILSSELNKQDIDVLIDRFKERTGFNIIPHQFYKGKRVLMYLKTNPFKEYLGIDDELLLANNKHVFEVKTNNNITEIIEKDIEINQEYNSRCNKLIIL